LLKEAASFESSKPAARNIILWPAIYVNLVAKFQVSRRKKNRKTDSYTLNGKNKQILH
jgi:hypothetical protein